MNGLWVWCVFMVRRFVNEITFVHGVMMSKPTKLHLLKSYVYQAVILDGKKIAVYCP